jgi:HEPN superfamily RiboL-PSP-like protein
MANTFAENALKEFDATLDELGSSLEFLKASSKLRPRLGDFLDWPGMSGDAKSLVGQYFKHTSPEPIPFYRGIVIILVGTLEHLLRNLIQEAVLRLSQTTATYDELDDKIKKENIRRSGQALTTIVKPLDHFEFDYYSLCKNLGSCIPGSKEFRLNAVAFGVFISTMGSDNLEEAFRRLGINLDWDELARDSGLQRFFDRSTIRETNKDIQDYLTDFIKKRNKLAHTGGSGITFSSDEIENLIRFVRLLGKRLAVMVNRESKSKK